MPLDRANYVGREQAYIKHRFLADYVEQLVFKVASRRDVVYIDGFSGPWLDQGEKFEDTSFGIALGALRRAKQTWKSMGRGERTMTALLVEKDPAAYARLQAIVPMYPDVDIRTFNGDFLQLVPALLSTIPRDAFSFLLMDPKGWKIDMAAVAPLLRRPGSEIVFNFMFTMINWSASIPNAAIQATLDALMPGTGWRTRLDNLRMLPGEAVADGRKRVLISAITETIERLGDFRYVMETPVLFPTKDRTFYSLIYATRAEKGVEVFRDCQHNALKEQDQVRADLKLARRDDLFGTSDLFGATVTDNDFAARWMAEQETLARETLVKTVPMVPASIRYGDLWPPILARHGVRKVRLGRMAAELRTEGRIRFLDWGPRKQVPDDAYRVTR